MRIHKKWAQQLEFFWTSTAAFVGVRPAFKAPCSDSADCRVGWPGAASQAVMA